MIFATFSHRIFRPIAKIENSGIYLTLIVALVTVNGRQKSHNEKKM